LAGRPFVSGAIVAICVSIFLALALENNDGSWQSLAKWGVLPATTIWEGAYWGLLPGVFVHLAVWHLAFNMYWLWVLGSRLESAIGHVWFLAFFVAAGFVSSSFQLAMSDSTGIGASGVVYAIFGFMWAARFHFQNFRDVLDRQTANIFMIWLVACIAVTALDVWTVGNAAHVSGMLFGGVVAGCFVLKRRMMVVALAMLLIASITPLVWCPWSVTWLSNRAYHAHAGGHYREALAHYARIIQEDPQSAWAYFNRGSVYDALGDPEMGDVDRRRAREIDPLIDSRD
jgi:GlpG protein